MKRLLIRKLFWGQLLIAILTTVITYTVTYFFYREYVKNVLLEKAVLTILLIILLMSPFLVGFSYIFSRWLEFEESRRVAGQNKFKGDLVQNISHEVRTPLTSITGHTQILESMSENLNEIQKSCLSRISSSSKFLSSIFDDILELSMLENEAPLFIEEINSRDLISHIVSLLKIIYKDKNLQIHLDIADVEFEGDSKLIEMSFKNVIENAFKYSPSEKEVYIGLKDKGEIIKLVVRDMGAGISEEDQVRVFERFFRSSEVRNSQIKGSGLGLSITKHAVNRHNGKVWVVSILNHGSSFFIELPKKHNS